MKSVFLIACTAALGALPAAGAPPLSLDEALRLAQERSPLLAAQRAAAEAAASLVGPAGQNPDPRLFVGLENVPLAGADRWSTTAESMTMRRVGVMQDFVRDPKLQAREARAAADAQREALLQEARRSEVQRDAALAWLERYYAERSRERLAQLAGEAELQEASAQAALAAGQAPSAESFAARALRATIADRMQEAERQARRAGAGLARWIGEDAARPLGPLPEIRRLPRDVRRLEVDAEMHPEHAVQAPLEAAAEAELRLAEAAKLPDWSVQLAYARRGGEYRRAAGNLQGAALGGMDDPVRSNPHMFSIMLRVDLPIFGERRQDPVVTARMRQLEQVRAQSEESRRRHLAEVRMLLVDWEVTLERLKRHRDELLPLASERARASRAAYEGGRGGLAAVLDARRGAIEAELAALGVEMEAARAWAQLAFLIPDRSAP